jgi:hypothetical protein
LPASLGGSAFAHYDQAVHGDGKFLYLLSITTNEQHGSELNEDESDDNVKENPTAPPLANHFSPVTAIPGGNNLKSSCIPASNMSDDKLLTCSLVAVNMSYSPMALAYQ